MPDVGPLLEPLNSIPVDREHHWPIWDQTKAEFKAFGRIGIIIKGRSGGRLSSKVHNVIGKARLCIGYNATEPETASSN